MDWFTAENGVKILAVIGAAYALARAIVALTPTKKDDAWLEQNISPIIRKLSQLFGLDLTHGRKAK